MVRGGAEEGARPEQGQQPCRPLRRLLFRQNWQGGAVGELHRDEAKLVAWLARAEEGRGMVLCGELGVEVRRRSARGLHGVVWAAAARLVAVTTMAAHAQARGERESLICSSVEERLSSALVSKKKLM